MTHETIFAAAVALHVLGLLSMAAVALLCAALSTVASSRSPRLGHGYLRKMQSVDDKSCPVFFAGMAAAALSVFSAGMFFEVQFADLLAEHPWIIGWLVPYYHWIAAGALAAMIWLYVAFDRLQKRLYAYEECSMSKENATGPNT